MIKDAVYLGATLNWMEFGECSRKRFQSMVKVVFGAVKAIKIDGGPVKSQM